MFLEKIGEWLPNMDGVTSPDEADQLRRQLSDLKAVVMLLEAYAEKKALAMRLRAKGQIKRALEWDRECDVYRGQLPGWAKW
jgi:hypothetical protein